MPAALDNALTSNPEDIVQQTFLQFHVNRKRYAPKTGVLALLYKMVGDNCTEHLRRVAEKNVTTHANDACMIPTMKTTSGLKTILCPTRRQTPPSANGNRSLTSCWPP